MSHSFRKIPIFGCCGPRVSEKKDKRLANRRLRRQIKQKLYEWGEVAELPILREVSNVWSFQHDGKYYQQYLWDHKSDITLVINSYRNYRHDVMRYRKDYKPKKMRK